MQVYFKLNESKSKQKPNFGTKTLKKRNDKISVYLLKMCERNDKIRVNLLKKCELVRSLLVCVFMCVCVCVLQDIEFIVNVCVCFISVDVCLCKCNKKLKPDLNF